MKKVHKVLIFGFCLMALAGHAQTIEIDSVTQSYQSQGVVETGDVDKEEAFAKALEWVALNYKSADDVIQFKDKESGKIILKGNYGTGLFGKKGWIKHTLTLEFKDGRYRYTFTDLSYYSPGSGEMPFEKKMFAKQKVIEEAESNMKSAIESLNEIIRAKSSDW